MSVSPHTYTIFRYGSTSTAIASATTTAGNYYYVPPEGWIYKPKEPVYEDKILDELFRWED